MNMHFRRPNREEIKLPTITPTETSSMLEEFVISPRDLTEMPLTNDKSNVVQTVEQGQPD